MRKVNYVTSSSFKKKEIEVFLEHCRFPDGKFVKELFSYNIYENPIHERLEVDIEKMVRYEVKEAYSQVKVPCFVEHAGLIFQKYKLDSYPGGLTKPLWNTLQENFLEETNSANIPVTARAVVAYCDGKIIKTFIGETDGFLSASPRGKRKFYWDTVFIPDKELGLTYAEIVETKGLPEKMIKYSQSAKALLQFLQYLRENESGDLWVND